jgi:hydrogenase expression/formation protein
MDLEGYARRGIRKNDKALKEKLAERILEIKSISRKRAEEIAGAVILEAEATMNPKGKILEPIISGVTMGEFGVGSRGAGDFYTHEKIAEVIGKTSAVVDSSHLDDSGVVRAGGSYIVVTIDGMHSRLSDFPFLAGFHAARAAVRDVYVMGARPVAMLSDIHVADDGDVGKIFDHIAGITAISELTGIPLITGSTLRIGGDMVIGERMTGGVGAVGVTDCLTARIQAKPKDVILMTEGAGGGTVSTAALYCGMQEIVDETINLKFIDACEALFEAGMIEYIHAMTDVTNGGVRGDAKEIARTAGVKLVFDEGKLRTLVNRKVLGMLDKLEIDYLGVSLDALLIIASPGFVEVILECVRRKGVSIDIVGKVEDGKGAELIIDGIKHDFTPRFRESAYTPIKKLVGDKTPRNFETLKKSVDGAAAQAFEKKRLMIERLKNGKR